MAIWKGSIIAGEDLKIENLQLSVQDGSTSFSLPPSHFQLLSIVQMQKVPLYLAAGPTLLVETNSEASKDFFTRILLHELLSEDDPVDPQPDPWFETPQLQSPLGILVRVFDQPSLEESTQPRITELLFFAARVSGDGLQAVPTAPLSTIHLYATPLSSDLLYQPSLQDPDVSLEQDQGHLLTPTHDRRRRDMITKKHERINGIFDTAPDRRKKARHLRAQSISEAAASATDPLRVVKVEEGATPAPLDMRPPIARAAAAESKRSSLSQVTTEGFECDSVEAKNKQVISRLVILGMRLYGLHQRKTSGVPDEGDDEFKAVYHQTYKGVVFTFRRLMNVQVLQTEPVREIVDQFLRLFCTEPLTQAAPPPPPPPQDISMVA